MAELVGVGQRVSVGFPFFPLHTGKNFAPGFLRTLFYEVKVVQAMQQHAWFPAPHIARALEMVDILAKGAHVSGRRELISFARLRGKPDGFPSGKKHTQRTMFLAPLENRPLRDLCHPIWKA